MAGFSRSARVGAVAGLFVAELLAGQSRAAGRVVRIVAGDTVPIPGLAVVLHRVGRASQGPLDSVRAGPGGRFAFRFTADTTAAYLLSARHDGVEYFSAPLAVNPAHPDSGVVMIVADTSSQAPVGIRQRTLLISRADESGTRTILDWFVVSNAGEKTRVAPDTLHASWGALLPAEAQNVGLADSRLSQFGPEALDFRRDSVLVFAPVSPGDKELMLQYRIPGTLRRFVIPTAAVSDSVFVLVEGNNGVVLTPEFASVDSQTIEGQMFQRWTGTVRTAGDIQVALSAPQFSTAQLLLVLAGVSALAFAGLGIGLTRRRAGTTHRFTPTSPLQLADAAARLDQQFAGREAVTPPEEWNRYLEERSRLSALLQRVLSTGRRRS